jgi:hypothetical protein
MRPRSPTLDDADALRCRIATGAASICRIGCAEYYEATGEHQCQATMFQFLLHGKVHVPMPSNGPSAGSNRGRWGCASGGQLARFNNSPTCTMFLAGPFVPLYFRCGTSPVKHRDVFNVIGSGTRWCILYGAP